MARTVFTRYLTLTNGHEGASRTNPNPMTWHGHALNVKVMPKEPLANLLKKSGRWKNLKKACLLIPIICDSVLITQWSPPYASNVCDWQKWRGIWKDLPSILPQDLSSVETQAHYVQGGSKKYA